MNSVTKIYLGVIATLAITVTISLLFNHVNAWVGFLFLFLFLGIVLAKGKNILEWMITDSKPKKQTKKTKNKTTNK